MRERIAYPATSRKGTDPSKLVKKLQRCVRDCLSAPARSAVTLNCVSEFTAGWAEDEELGGALVSPWVWH